MIIYNGGEGDHSQSDSLHDIASIDAQTIDISDTTATGSTIIMLSPPQTVPSVESRTNQDGEYNSNVIDSGVSRQNLETGTATPISAVESDKTGPLGDNDCGVSMSVAELERQNSDLIVANEDQKKVIEMLRVELTKKDDDLLSSGQRSLNSRWIKDKKV